MAFRATLAKSERLKNKKAIEKLFQEGKSLYKFPLKIFYTIQDNDAQGLQFKMGVSVPKSKFKKAVQRNRLKRVIREAYRHKKCQVQSQLHTIDKTVELFVVYITGDDKEDMIENRLGFLLDKLAAEISS